MVGEVEERRSRQRKAAGMACAQGICLATWERLSIFPTTCLSPMGKVGFLLSSKTRRITQMLLLWAPRPQCHPQLPGTRASISPLSSLFTDTGSYLRMELMVL